MSDQIDSIIAREGAPTNNPHDSGGRTAYGISEKAHPEAWADGVVTYPEARAIYEKVYLTAPHFSSIKDDGLQHQLVDFGVTAGPETVIKILQQLIGVEADGVIGPGTLAAIDAMPGKTLFGLPIPGSVRLNLALRDARVLHYAYLAKKDPKNLEFLLGWVKRAQEFS